MIIRVQLLIFCAIYVLCKNDNIESDNLCNVINYPHVAILYNANQNMFFLSHPITRTCYVEFTCIGDLMIVRRVWLPCLEEQLKITISTKS